MAGDSEEPFQLDGLIPTGLYRLAGVTESIAGEECVLLERRGLDRLWLARNKAWAIVRREWNWTIGGSLKRRVDNRDFREIAPGLWLPWSGSMEVFGHPATRPNQRVGTLRVSVIEAEAGLSDGRFELDVPKGTEILDVSTGDVTRFGLEGEELEKALIKASAFRPTFRSTRWSNPYEYGFKVLCILMGIAALFVGWWLFGRSRATK
jgi:hypothetical protein